MPVAAVEESLGLLGFSTGLVQSLAWLSLGFIASSQRIRASARLTLLEN